MSQQDIHRKLCKYVLAAAGMPYFTGTWLLAAALRMSRHGLTPVLSETGLWNV